MTEHDHPTRVPDDLDGTFWAEQVRGGPDRPLRLPALEPAVAVRLQEASDALHAAGVALGAATGDALRELAAAVGVHPPNRLAVFEVAAFGGHDELARLAIVGTHGAVDITADAAPAPLWHTACDLFEVSNRKLKMRGDRDQALVWALDERFSATRAISAVFDEHGEPYGQMGRWTTVWHYTISPSGKVLNGKADGERFTELTARLEELMGSYQFRFVQWPDANP